MEIKDYFQQLGELVESKNKAYGNAWLKAAELLKLYFPDGIKPDQYIDVLLLARIADKISRIAINNDPFNEDPWQDISGYAGLRALDKRNGNGK